VRLNFVFFTDSVSELYRQRMYYFSTVVLMYTFTSQNNVKYIILINKRYITYIRNYMLYSFRVRFR
jgi:hypothetical protein